MTKKITTLFVAMLFSAVYSSQDSSSALLIETHVPAGVWFDGQAIGNTPLFTKTQPGWSIYSVRSPGHWSQAHLANFKPGKQITHNVLLKKYGLPVRDIPDMHSINELKTLETLYDSLYRIKLGAAPDSLCVAHFAADYHLPIFAPDSLHETSPIYRRYFEIYNTERQHSFEEFYANCLGAIEQDINLILTRMNELGTKQVTGIVPVVLAKFESEDTSGLKGGLEVYFLSPDGRAEVAWKGVWENEFLTGDALVKALTSSSPIALSFLTAQNQTVWIPAESGFSRHFYKYHEFNISWNGRVIPMNGEFLLPDYIKTQPKVTEWLAGMEPVVIAVADTLPIDTLPKDTVKQQEYESLINKAFIAMIPEGSLKYKGKNVPIKQFAINTSEINQNLYNEKCGKKDFGKYKGDSLPAHSVTWKEANNCCIALGGDLPTEAQWEYAARAGSPAKYAWTDSAANYAVYNGKKPATAGGKKPNGWGLYDMFGNVSEWVKDDGFWFGKYKFLKGGNWKSKEKDLKIENHEEEDTRYWGSHVGFRCVFNGY